MIPPSYNVWFAPQSIQVNQNANFALEVHVNTGTQKLCSYQFSIEFDSNLVDVDTSIGNNGVEPGIDGFVTSVNDDNPGQLLVNGFDVDGKGPGDDLHVLTVHFKS